MCVCVRQEEEEITYAELIEKEKGATQHDK